MAVAKTPLIAPVQGVSEEHPQFRIPQRVTEMMNLIPDIKKGIYTRPGVEPVMDIDIEASDLNHYYEIVEFPLDDEQVEVLIEIIPESGIYLYRLDTKALIISFTSQLILDYIDDIDSYSDFTIHVSRDVIYLVNRNKKLILKALSSSTIFTITSAHQFPPKFTVYAKYTTNSGTDVDTSYSLTIQDFIDAGNSMSPTYDRSGETDYDPMVNLFADMLIELRDQAEAAGVFPEISTGKKPFAISTNTTTKEVAITAGNDVILAIYYEDDPYLTSFVSQTNVGDTKPEHDGFINYNDWVDFKDSNQAIKYTISASGSDMSQLTFISETGEVVNVYGPDIPNGALDIFVVKNANNEYIATIYGGNPTIIYVHPRWYIKIIQVYDSQMYGSSISTTITYKGSSDTITYPYQSSPDWFAINDQTDIIIYHPALQITFNKSGYEPDIRVYLSNNFTDTIKDITDNNVRGRIWGSQVYIATQLEALLTSDPTYDLTAFDPNIVVLRTDENLTIQIPWYIDYHIEITPHTTNFDYTYTSTTNETTSLQEDITPLRLYQISGSWTAEHVPMDFSVETSIAQNVFLGISLLSQLSGSTIRDLIIYQNRLVVLTEAGLVASKTDNFEQFLPDDLNTYTDADPFNVTFATSGDTLEYILPFSDQLVIFGRHGQYSVFHNGIFSLTNLKVVPATQYDILLVKPVTAGSEIYFLVRSENSETGAHIRKFIVQPNTQIKTAYDVTPHLVQYLPTNIARMFYLTQHDILVMFPDNINDRTSNKNIYLLKQTYNNGEILQQAIFKFYFKYSLLGISANQDNNQLYLIFVDESNNISLHNLISLYQNLGVEKRVDNFQFNGVSEDYAFEIDLTYAIPATFIESSKLGYFVIQEIAANMLGYSNGHSTFESRPSLDMIFSIDASDGNKLLRLRCPRISVKDIAADQARFRMYTNSGENNNLNLLGFMFEFRTYPNRKWHGEIL